MQNFERDVKQDMEETRFLVCKSYDILFRDFLALKEMLSAPTFINMRITDGIGGDDLFVTEYHIVESGELQDVLDSGFSVERVGSFEDLYVAV